MRLKIDPTIKVIKKYESINRELIYTKQEFINVETQVNLYRSLQGQLQIQFEEKASIVLRLNPSYIDFHLLTLNNIGCY